jgi:predicted nucleic acid-binding protein
VTKDICDRWAILSARAQRRGAPLGVVDGFIAATALVHDLTVVTRNTKDFDGLGVALYNPWSP